MVPHIQYCNQRDVLAYTVIPASDSFQMTLLESNIIFNYLVVLLCFLLTADIFGLHATDSVCQAMLPVR